MDNQRRQQLVEQYEEIALSLLMDDYANEEGARLMKEFEEAQKNGEIPEMPAELDEKCRKLIDKTFAKQERKVRLTRIGKSAAKAAVITLVALGLLTTTVMSVDALRIPVLNFLLDSSGKFQTVILDPTQHVKYEESTVVGRLEEFAPEGYLKVQNEYFPDGSGMVCYTNDDGHVITLDISPSDGTLNIDAEDTNYIPMTISGCAVVFSEKNGYSMMWMDENTDEAYTLRANGLDEEAFLALAYAIIV